MERRSRVAPCCSLPECPAIFYSPESCAWVKLIRTVPCTAISAARHSPTLSSVNVKPPTAWLFREGCTHCTCTHGCRVTPRLKGQPTMVNVSVERSTKLPTACTLVSLDITLTIPPCGHCMMLEVLRRPATTSPPVRHH